MADFVYPPLELPAAPAALPTDVALNPPMVGFASPFTHADGQNRDLILESLRSWLANNLPGWANGLQTYVTGSEAATKVWADGLATALGTYVTDELEAQNIVVTDALAAAVQAVITSSLTVTEPTITLVQRTHFKTVNVRDYTGLSGGGTGRFSDKLKEAIAAVDSGGTVIADPGTYAVYGESITVDKDLLFEFGGSRFILMNASGPGLTFTGTFDTAYSCASILPGVLGGPAQWAGTLDGSGNPTTPIDSVRLTLVAPMARTLRRGDLVKLVNDTALQGQRDENTPGWDPTTQAVCRYGQFMPVESQSTDRTSLVLAGTLREFTKYNDTNTLRVAYLARPKITIRNLTMELPADVDPGARAGLRLANLVGATVENPTIASAGALLSVVSCYDTTIINPLLGPGRDDATISSFGYGIFDNGSTNTTVIGGTIQHVRHAYTDDSTRFLPGGSIASYGRSFNSKLVGVSAVATTNTAFDTHLHGNGHQFIGCSADGCWRGFSLRGFEHIVTDGIVRDSPTALVFTDEVTSGGWSWGHKVDGLKVVRAKRVISGYVNGAGHPNQNTGERRNTVITGLVATEITERAIDLGNMNLVINDSLFSFAATDVTGGLFNVYGAARLVSDAGLRVELRGLTGANLPVIPVFYLPSSTADIEISGIRIRSEAALTAGLVSIPSGSGSFLTDGLLTFGSPSTFPDGNIVSWADKTGNRPSTLVVNNDALFVGGTFLPAIADVGGDITVKINLATTGQSFPAIANGRRNGQKMTLINQQTSKSFTIAAASNVLLPSGTATPNPTITVPIGGVVQLQWAQGGSTSQWVKVVG